MKNKNRYGQGMVVFLALILFLALIFWLSNSNFPFASSYRLEVKFDSAGGLLDQAKVLLRGYRVGFVKGIEFEPDGVVAILSINKAYRVPAGSTCAVINYNFIGERAVSITPSRAGEFLPPKARIRGENQDMMTDAQALFSELRRRLSGNQLDNLDRLVSRLENFMENLHPELSVSLPPQFKDDLKTLRETVEAMRLTFEESGGRVNAMTADIQAFVKKLDGLLELAERNQTQLDKILQKLSTPESSAGKFIQDREFWEMTKDTLEKLNEFLKELKANPKKYFKVSIF